MSSRVPIFRAFPRVGLPPRFDSWADFERRVEQMSAGGMIEDYTTSGTTSVPIPGWARSRSGRWTAQTRVEHTVALSAIGALAREAA